MEETGRLEEAPFVLLFLVEMSIEISMSFEYIQNLEGIVDIAEKDHVPTKCEATHVVPQFWPQTAHLTG
ncbi:hypothetical protein FBZ98_103852 [Rhizobium sp. ERR 922]|nr:hypothetical protein FBZ98_103852 [Rhizobium sp. ERR 922]TWB97212.1 hypothetical protein FBZ97_10332 [Rhizobium sp. ERR 942]